MKLALRIALRYFFSRKKSGSFQVISLILGVSLGAYIVGSAALIIILSVFNGFEQLFSGMFSAFDADFQIQPKTGKVLLMHDQPIQQIMHLPEVAHASFVLEENVLLNYNNKQTIATMRAVDSTYTSAVPLDSNIVRGVYLLQSADTPFVLVGQGLGYQLGVDPDDIFTRMGVYAPRKGDVDLLNPMEAFTRESFIPSGVFAIQDEVDSKYILMPLKKGQDLLGRTADEAGWCEIRLKPTTSPKAFRDKMAQLSSKYTIKSRFELRDSFYKVMRSERFISFMILFFIMIIASFNTIGSMYMVVLDKKRDLGIFRSLGMTPTQAAWVFMLNSVFLAISGCVLGILSGAGICWLQQTYGMVGINGETFTVNAYPVQMKMLDILAVFGSVCLLGFITAIYPARKAYLLLQSTTSAQ